MGRRPHPELALFSRALRKGIPSRPVERLRCGDLREDGQKGCPGHVRRSRHGWPDHDERQLLEWAGPWFHHRFSRRGWNRRRCLPIQLLLLRGRFLQIREPVEPSGDSCRRLLPFLLAEPGSVRPLGKDRRTSPDHSPRWKCDRYCLGQAHRWPGRRPRLQPLRSSRCKPYRFQLRLGNTQGYQRQQPYLRRPSRRLGRERASQAGRRYGPQRKRTEGSCSRNLHGRLQRLRTNDIRRAAGPGKIRRSRYRPQPNRLSGRGNLLMECLGRFLSHHQRVNWSGFLSRRYRPLGLSRSRAVQRPGGETVQCQWGLGRNLAEGRLPPADQPGPPLLLD